MVKNSGQVKTILAAFIKLLEASVNLYAVVFFGSYVRGKPCEFSDIDLAVFSEDFGANPLDPICS